MPRRALRRTAGKELIEESLKALEGEFATSFVRVHRNSLVAIAHMEGLEKDADGHQIVRLRNGAGTLPVSWRLAAELAKKWGGYLDGSIPRDWLGEHCAVAIA